MTPPANTARLHAIDALRAAAMLLGVYLHTALAYMYTPHGVSPVTDPSRSYFFDATVAGIHGFRMQLFYVVSGIFAAMLIGRKGVRAFVVNRLGRIAVPLGVGALILCPMVAWTFIAGRRLTGVDAAGAGPWAALADAGASGSWMLGWAIPMHLWFLWYLLAMCVVAAALSAVLAGVNWSFPRVARFVGWSARSMYGLVPLAVLATLATLPMSRWMIDTPRGWSLSPTLLAYYGLFFGWGFVLYGCNGGLAGVARRYGWLTLIAVVSYFLLVVAAGLSTRLTAAGAPPVLANLPPAAAQAIFTWSAILAGFGLALRFLSHPTPRLAPVLHYVADASYWIYLTHLPLIYFLHVVLYPWPASAFVKVPVIIIVTFALTLATYATLVRHTFIGRQLNGPRRRPLLHGLPATTAAQP